MDKSKPWCPVTAMCHFLLNTRVRYKYTIFTGFRGSSALLHSREISLLDFLRPISSSQLPTTSVRPKITYSHSCTVLTATHSQQHLLSTKSLDQSLSKWSCQLHRLSGAKQQLHIKQGHHRTTCRASSDSPSLHPIFNSIPF